jgi:hypothetical protein
MLFLTMGWIVAFAAGWGLKPAPMPGTEGSAESHGHRDSSRIAGPQRPPAAEAQGLAGEAVWLGEAAGDLEAIRAARESHGRNGRRLLVEKLSVVLTLADPAERLARFQTLLSLMAPEDADAVREMLWKNRSEGRPSEPENAAFWKRWGQVDAAAALERNNKDAYGREPDILAGWARQDAEAALAWIKSHNPPPETMGKVLESIAEQSPQDALDLIRRNADDPALKSGLGVILESVVRKEGLSGAMEWMRDLARGDAPASLKAQSVAALLEKYSSTPGPEIFTFRQSEIADFAAEFTGEPWFSKRAAAYLGEQFGMTDPQAGGRVLDRFSNPDVRAAFEDPLLDRWATKDLHSLSVWLSQNPDSPAFTAGVCKLVNRTAASDPEAARA